MAEEAQAQPAHAQAMVLDKEKIPLFHADAKQDSFQPEYWIQRMNRLQVAHGWTDAQTVCHAVNSLRGEAIHFVEFMEESFGIGTTETNWILFKDQFLLAFGKKARDTSSVANLAILQRDKETVQKFAHRVVVTTKEFFMAMNAPDEPNLAAVPNNENWVQTAQNPIVQQLIRYFVKECAATIRAVLNKTIFLNGLKKEINSQVKNTTPVTWLDAVNNAIVIDRNLNGPIDHTIALEKSATSSTSVNFIKRGGFRGRGRGGHSSSRQNGSAGFNRNKSNSAKTLECWYCRKPGHAQKFCRKRIARGADTVPQPRSVAEISADYIDYQDASDNEEEGQDDNDVDEYLADVLEEEVNSIHINLN